MLNKNPRNISYVISFALHILLLILFTFITFSAETEADDYVTIGFGSGMSMGSPGPFGQDQLTEKNQPKEEQLKEKNEEQKKVELPETKNKERDNVVVEADKKKKKENVEAEKVKPLNESLNRTKGTEPEGDAEGGFGFEIDFGGKGMRKIYSYILPEYPEGVAKEIDVKLRFTILPDGTVGKIFPLIKADARLELAAINSLRQWRFEPLPVNAKQIEQTVIVTFPYRLQ
ncbi:MAG: energy transducer TonB [Ignavibacteriales bacterium]|nr:energy transducer TonB [Ignavibacteriales bacterium]